MPRLDIYRNAGEQIRRLPADNELMQAIWVEIELVADDPDENTEPAPYPHIPGRRLRTFRVIDSTGREWAGSLTFAVTDDVVQLRTVTASPNAADYPVE